MPAGVTPMPVRPSWTSNRDNVLSRTVPTGRSASSVMSGTGVSVVYGADTSFSENDPVTDAWAVRPLTPPKVDPRAATRTLSVSTDAKSVEAVSVPENKVFNPDTDPRFDKRFALYPLSRDEVETSASILNSGSAALSHLRLLRMCPTHNMGVMGDFGGYRSDAHPADTLGSMPINRTMFHGVSAVQCMKSARSGDSCPIGFLKSDMEHCRGVMLELMRGISADAAKAVEDSTVARFDCAPCNTDAVAPVVGVFATDSGSRMRDSRGWVCDEPATIGIYEAYVRRFNREREHRIFVICTGGCRTACDEFMNITTDLATHTSTTAGEMCESEEVWWLRKLCSRMRNRLLSRTAAAFGLNIPVMNDVQSFDPCQTMAVPSIETCTHDIGVLRNGNIAVYNECVDTTVPRKGTMCAMNPSEGFHWFNGPPSTSNGAQDHGGVFGKQTHCGVFPTSASRVTGLVDRYSTSSGCPIVTDFCAGGPGGVFVYKDDATALKQSHFQKFDEVAMNNLKDMGWSRDNDKVEIMPIVIGVFN